MDMREYEEFSLTLESIRRGIDKLIDTAKKNSGSIFFWAALSPDVISDCGLHLKAKTAVVTKDPKSYILSKFDAENGVFYILYAEALENFQVGVCTYDHD